MLASLKRFVMMIIEALEESATRRANRYTYQYRLDQYIISKNPTTAAEVDHWIKEFDKKESLL